MRWEQLFSDLDARFDELADAAMMAELADRQRVAAGVLQLTARLGGALGQAIRVRTTSGVAVGGLLRRVGPDWVLLQEGPGREAVVRLAAVTAIEGLTSATAAPIAGVALRLDLRHMLRGVARDRSPVAVVIPGSSGIGVEGTGTEITGTIDRVGADFLELAVHAPWEPRRASSVRSMIAIPLAAVVLVRALPLG
jgi:hypothetical protein